MSKMTNAIILIDMMQAGIRLNMEQLERARQREIEGREITMEDLQELADENDASWEALKAKLGQ